MPRSLCSAGPVNDPGLERALPSYLRRLPRFIFVPDPNVARYVVRAFALDTLPSIAIAILLSALIGDSYSSRHVRNLPAFVIGALLLAPILETLMLALWLSLLRRLIGRGPAVVASAATWGILHALTNSLPNGLVVWWGFLIMSIAYVTWSASGRWRAFAIVAAMHALNNGTAVAFLLLAGSTDPSTADQKPTIAVVAPRD